MESKRIGTKGWKRLLMTRIGMPLLGVLCMALLACREKSGSGDAAPEPQPQAAPAEANPAAPRQASPPLAIPSPAGPAAKSDVKSEAKPGMKTGRIDFNIPLTPITKPLAGLSGFAGRKMLVFYFGPTCPHCQAALPEVQAFAAEIRGSGYETVAIANARSNEAEIQEFITKYKCTLPVFWDDGRKFGGAYGVTVLPTLFLVGPEGDFIRTDGYTGKPTLDTLRRAL